MNATETKGSVIATADGQTWWGCEEVAEFGGVFDPGLLGRKNGENGPVLTNGRGWLYNGVYNELITGPFGSEVEANQWLRQALDERA